MRWRAFLLPIFFAFSLAAALEITNTGSGIEERFADRGNLVRIERLKSQTLIVSNEEQPDDLVQLRLFFNRTLGEIRFPIDEELQAKVETNQDLFSCDDGCFERSPVLRGTPETLTAVLENVEVETFGFVDSRRDLVIEVSNGDKSDHVVVQFFFKRKIFTPDVIFGIVAAILGVLLCIIRIMIVVDSCKSKGEAKATENEIDRELATGIIEDWRTKTETP